MIKLINKTIEIIIKEDNNPSTKPFFLAMIPLNKPNIKNNINPTINVILLNIGLVVKRIPFCNNKA